MAETILVPVAIAAICGVIAWTARLFMGRPKLLVSYRSGDGMSTVGPAGMLEVRWSYKVTITNVTKHDALEISVRTSTNPQVVSLPADHIKALDRLELERKLVKNLDKALVVDARHDFHGALEPPELKDLAFVLAYRGEGGLVRYTRYSRVKGTDENRLSMF